MYEEAIPASTFEIAYSSIADFVEYLDVFILSRISDDMLLGAIATTLGIWVTGIMITICYLVIRN
jgi:hypothetical protein